MGLKMGSKLPISLKVVPPEVANLHKEVLSHQRFDTVTSLGQITIFRPFWSTLWSKMGKNYPFR